MELMICEHCGKHRDVMVAMQPGKGGAPWSLCNRCWADGLRPTRVTVTTTTEGTSYMPERSGLRQATDPPGLAARHYTEVTTQRVLVEQAPKAKTKRRAAR